MSEFNKRGIGRNHDRSLRRNYQFIFIVGVSGSGTTMLTRILSSPDTVIGLGGNYNTIPNSDETAHLLATQFNKVTADLWDRKATHKQYQRAKSNLLLIIDSLLRLKNYSHASHILYKRSAPFNLGDQYRPDLSDLFDLFENPRIIVLYRDPRASTFSSFRRRFAENLRQCAIICEEQLTYLSSQLATLDHNYYRVISYQDLCSQPETLIKQLAEFCQLSVDILLRAAEKENIEPGRNERWLQALDPSEIDFLIKFFDTRRLSQWTSLFSSES